MSVLSNELSEHSESIGFQIPPVPLKDTNHGIKPVALGSLGVTRVDPFFPTYRRIEVNNPSIFCVPPRMSRSSFEKRRTVRSATNF